MNLEEERRKLVRQLRREITDQRVLEVMERLPRELFIPLASRAFAYDDRPLPIGDGQTISQPFIVALMTQALGLVGTEKVLEVGTGSGYQAAILAQMAREVVSVERFPDLAATAERTLEDMGYTNVQVHLAEGTLGWRAGAPYDAILVTAAAPSVPRELVAQLAVGGRMVIPVGSRWEQDLLKVTKQADGLKIQTLTACRFVPLVGEEAWSEEP
ncbi:MAG: protein-L-isoaspartate(D-aspartate) O-methyltransferase [Chloroflexota bacterium]|nr:protein-L-isoaspartate(D-aspartate) O-methyltransferase [Chloroflexota bacterium]